MIIKIYGYRSVYSTGVIHWYRYRPDAEKACKEANDKFPDLEYRIVTAYYDNGDD